MVIIDMPHGIALGCAAKRLADITQKIEAQRACIRRLPAGVRHHAEQLLASYEATRAEFQQHYLSLSGDIEEYPGACDLIEP